MRLCANQVGGEPALLSYVEVCNVQSKKKYEEYYDMEYGMHGNRTFYIYPS